jgi:hypothetical protein
MRVAKQDIETKLDMPGVVMRQRRDFGTAKGYERISAEYFTLAAGVDTTPLFMGLEGNLCQCPHWGYVLSGKLTTTDTYGFEESVISQDLFYWPPGHNVKVDEDAEIVMFSPQHEHTSVLDHMIRKISG